MTKGYFIAVITVFLTLCLSAFASHAQEKKSWEISAKIMSGIPQEDSTITTIGGSIDMTESLAGAVEVAYFFTDKIAMEAGIITGEYDVGIDGSTSGNLNLGSVWMTNASLTAQYHFQPEKKLSPYVGAGISYNFFSRVKNGSGVTNINYDSGIGSVLQAGVDIPYKNIYFNLEAKKIFFNTDITFNNNTRNADTDIDPLIVGGGVSYRF